jgi:hypothetical protein
VPESRLKKLIKDLMEELSIDMVEERAVGYIIRELKIGRSLKSVLSDAYIKNRLNEERLAEVLENKKIVEAVEEAVNQAFANKDFKFLE